MNFCSNCGEATIHRVPEGDNRPRDICEQCGMIHYQNPKIIAGCVVLEQNKVLLCKRAIEPRYGLWTLPAGFMENGETVAQAALRETWEEARVQLLILINSTSSLQYQELVRYTCCTWHTSTAASIALDPKVLRRGFSQWTTSPGMS